MLKIIYGVGILLALLIAIHVGYRFYKSYSIRIVTDSLKGIDEELLEQVFGEPSECSPDAVALLAQTRYLMHRIRSLGDRPITVLQADIDEHLADFKLFTEGQPVLALKRGVILSGYVSRIDDSLQTYSLYVPPSYDEVHAMPLVVSLHGHGWFRPWQGHPAPRYPGAIVLSPQGRGATDYMGIGEVDVLRAIEEVKRFYVIDEKRVFITGTSMGGTGAWYLAARNPHLFAGIAPRAGNCDAKAWEKRWGWNSPIEGRHDDLRTWLLESDSPITYLGNLAHMPVSVVHAAGDTIVPVEHARAAVEKLRKLDAPVEYREYMVGHHGDFQSHVAHDQLAWVAGRAARAVPTEYDYVTRDVRHGRSYFVTILQMEEVLKEASIKVKLADRRLEITTANVAALSVNLVDVPGLSEGLTVVIDSQKLPGIASDKAKAVWAVKSGENWKEVNEWPPDKSLRKVRAVEGPVQDALLSPFTVVIGTGGYDPQAWFPPAEEDAWQFVDEWASRNQGSPLVICDSDVTVDLLHKRNIVFFGRPHEDTLLKKVLDTMPITVTTEGIEVGGKLYKGESLGTIFCYPTPAMPGRMIVVVTGHTKEALYQAHSRFGNWFNWGVHDQRKWFDYCVFDSRTANPETFPVVGFFGTDWSLERGRSWTPTEAALKRTQSQHFPKHETVPSISSLYLSDLKPTEINQMRGAVGFDRSFRGNRICIGGETFDRGLGVRTPSAITYELAGNFTKLTAVAGLTDEPEEFLGIDRINRERATVIVKGDGKVLFKADLDWASPRADIDVDITGVSVLKLVVRPARGASWLHGSTAWADAKVERQETGMR